MIKLNALELLEKQGMINNETKSIQYENIETMCLLLNCTPNDLPVITED